MKKVFVLGSTGMLGKYVSTYLKDYYDVIEVSRKTLDVSEIKESVLRKNLMMDLKVQKGDIIINCIGTIKPRVDELGDLNAIIVNSVFPHLLSKICEELEVNLIHPTTDCIYTGLKGQYNENDKLDVNDVYGMSKGLGEPKNCTVIRTSIIGEEVNQGRSLVEWIKSNKDNTVFGFTNHLWNGITCLQFAKICQTIIDNNLFWKGIRHIHSNTVSKKELVELVSEIYELNITVTPKETPVKCDRSLSSVYFTLEVPTLRQQIIEMKEFSNKLFS